jgi:hypothetical protein
MNKTFLMILLIFIMCLFSNCRNGVTEESNPITTSNLINDGMPTQGLIAYYPFYGNVDDYSGNGNNGTNHGVTLTADRFGRANSACHFSGGSYIGIPELFPSTVSAFTFAAWIMKDTSDNAAHEILFKGLNQGQVSMGLLSGNAGFSVCLGNSPTNWNAASIQDTLKAKTYYFLVGRYIKGQKVEFFVNGTLAASLSIPNLPLYTNSSNNEGYSEIGTVSSQANYYWNGVLDDLRIFNRAISDEEVQALYHEGGWNGN